MLKKERQNYILHQINLHNKVLTADLCAAIDVSEDTIRRDLQELSDEGRLFKVHGGALSLSFHSSFRCSNIYAANEKRVIASKAVQLIKDGMYVMTTGGSTILEMIRMLPEQLTATFITTSIPAAVEYLQHPNIKLIQIGDIVSKQAQMAVGGQAIRQIRQIQADLCILGTNAIDSQKGITDSDWEVVQVKQAMIESSEKVMSVAIAEKLDTVQRINVCEAKDIDFLITEKPSNDLSLIPYAKAGITVY